MPAQEPSIRVVVRLPWNRPENAPSDPPPVEWTPEKSDAVWKVLEKKRLRGGGDIDWKLLAEHLQVPLRYLTYRVDALLQEDLRKLKDIQAAAGPPQERENTQNRRPSLTIRTGIQASSRLSSISTPSNIRARLSSLNSNYSRPPRKTASSSTLTVQNPKRTPLSLRPESPFSDESESEEERAMKEEEAERQAEEQEALDRKLEELQRMVASDALGLVRSKHKSRRSIDRDRGRLGLSSPDSVAGTPHYDSPSSRSASQSQSLSHSLSSLSSARGSIPEIPSSSPDLHSRSQVQSPQGKRVSPEKPSGTAISPRGIKGFVQNKRLSQVMGEPGSEASSFSDLSDTSLSLSASALESAFMSNMGSIRSTTAARPVFTEEMRSNHFGRTRPLQSGGSNTPY